MGIMTTGNQPRLLQGGGKKKKKTSYPSNIRSYPKPDIRPSNKTKKKGRG